MALSYSDFKTAITQLEDAWQDCSDTLTWQELSVKTSHYEPQVTFLRITRTLSFKSATVTSENGQNHTSQDEESDEEALWIPNITAPAYGTLVTYDIIYHSTYNCPTLFIDVSSSDGTRYGTADIYELLVPAAYKQPLQFTGVMGSLSQADHPITNKPVYMVHPCRTPEAMKDVLAARKAVDDSHPEVDYLQAWFGAICGSVGLDIPVSLANVLSRGKSGEVRDAEA